MSYSDSDSDDYTPEDEGGIVDVSAVEQDEETDRIMSESDASTAFSPRSPSHPKSPPRFPPHRTARPVANQQGSGAQAQGGVRHQPPGNTTNPNQTSMLSSQLRSPPGAAARRGWAKLRRALRPPTDFLVAMGAMPSGFRPSTLGSAARAGRNLAQALTPALSDSGLGYEDLQVDPKTKSVASRKTSSMYVVRGVSAKAVPLPGVGARVVERKLRVALWDTGASFSNVHAIPAAWEAGDGGTWKFPPRVEPLLSSPTTKKYDESSVLIRANRPGLVLLFELTVTFYRPTEKHRQAAVATPASQAAINGQQFLREKLDLTELCCGWAVLPLTGADGKPAKTATYNLELKGGTPWDRSVPLDAFGVGHARRPGGMKGVLAALQGPSVSKLTIVLGSPKKVDAKSGSMLPDTIVAPLGAISLFALYREILADDLVKRPQSEVLAPAGLTVAAVFPTLLAAPDVFAALVVVWSAWAKKWKRKERKSQEFIKSTFRRVVLSMWPLIHMHDVPQFSLVNAETAYQRQSALQNYVNSILSDGAAGIVDSVSDHVNAPFHIRETTWNLSNAYAV